MHFIEYCYEDYGRCSLQNICVHFCQVWPKKDHSRSIECDCAQLLEILLKCLYKFLVLKEAYKVLISLWHCEPLVLLFHAKPFSWPCDYTALCF